MPYYMKFEGIEGPVKGKYKGWIELESCQLGTHRHLTDPTGRGTNRDADSPQLSEIVITKLQDAASTGLYLGSLWGEGKKVTIVFVHDNDVPYLTLELENTLISNFYVSGHGGDGQNKPLETVSLNFSAITYNTKAAATAPKTVEERASWQLVK